MAQSRDGRERRAEWLLAPFVRRVARCKWRDRSTTAPSCYAALLRRTAWQRMRAPGIECQTRGALGDDAIAVRGLKFDPHRRTHNQRRVAVRNVQAMGAGGGGVPCFFYVVQKEPNIKGPGGSPGMHALALRSAGDLLSPARSSANLAAPATTSIAARNNSRRR
jgi:hypothetical protein